MPSLLFRNFWALIFCAAAATSALASDLEDRLHATLSSSLREGCDLDLMDIKLEIAHALDARATEMTDWLNTHPELDPTFDLVKLGPIVMKERKTPLLPDDQWSEVWRDWASAINRYRVIQTLPVNYEWITLAEDVQWLVANDYRRLVDQRNFGLDERSPDLLNEARSAIDTCLADAGCTNPHWRQQIVDFLQKNRIYSDYVRTPPSHAVLSALKKRIQIDLKTRYQFWRMPNIVRVDENTWRVPMYSQDFSENLEEIAQRITLLWQQSDHDKVIIEWAHPPGSGDFRFIADLSVGARPGTSYRDQTVTLTNGMFTTTLPHEFGHVLGFRDQYFELWDVTRCGYRSRANGADIMSRSRQGVVLQSHWETLRTEYPR